MANSKIHRDCRGVVSKYYVLPVSPQLEPKRFLLISSHFERTLSPLLTNEYLLFLQDYSTGITVVLKVSADAVDLSAADAPQVGEADLHVLRLDSLAGEASSGDVQDLLR